MAKAQPKDGLKKIFVSTKPINGIEIYCVFADLADVDKLVPNPRNPNKHTQEQINRLAKIIATPSQGFRNPIVVSKRTGFIVKGHCRLEAAKMAGMKKVPCDYQDYENEASEWADMLADNKIAELATMDYAITGEVMLELDTLNFNLDLTGFDKMEIEGLMAGGKMPQGDEKEPSELITTCPNCGHEFDARGK